MRKTALLALSLMLLLPACTWVKTTPQGDGVQYVEYPDDAIKTCKELGTVTTMVKAKIGFFNRNEDKVNKELITLARNEAAIKGGDTITAEKPAADGRRTFIVYKCFE